MKTNDLIQALAQEITPIKKVRYNHVTVLKVISLAFFCIALTSFFGIRADILSKLSNLHFVFEILCLLLLAIASCISVLQLSIPGNATKSNLYFPLFTLGLWISLLTYSFLNESSSIYKPGFTCGLEILSISILPATLLFFFAKRAAPFKINLVGFLVLLSSASFGAIGVQLTCAKDSSLHTFVWHFGPTVLIACSGIFIARYLIKRI